MTTSAVGVVLAVSDVPECKEDVVHLDNQASVSVFKDSHLLHNIREADEPVTISGITGSSFKSYLVGDFRDLGTVYYHPSAISNLLCFAELIDSGARINYDADTDKFSVVSNNQQHFHVSKTGRCTSTQENICLQIRPRRIR